MKFLRAANDRAACAALARLELLAAIPCLSVLLVSAQSVPAPASASQGGSSTRAWVAQGEICVRLARFEAQSSLVVSGARSDAARLEIARAGAALTLNGKPLEEIGSRNPARELWIEAADPDSGLALGLLRYPGRLRIRILPGSPAGGEVGLAVDNIVELEDYVAGVVAGEVQLLGAAAAELEAQAIASRSFALAQLAARGSRSLEVRLSDTTRDQVYAGRFVPTRDPRSQAAARSLAEALTRTRGTILIDGGAVLDARFHAACGGRTANAADVFAEAARFEALRGVDCAACLRELGPRPAGAGRLVPASTRDLSWRTTLAREQLDQLARVFALGAHTLRLEPVRRDRSGRWLEVEIAGSAGSRRLSFESFRKQLADGAIGSNLVLVSSPRPGETIEGELMLSGRGRGHGVGLCQEGCHEYALHGWSSAQILAHYYPGSALVDGR